MTFWSWAASGIALAAVAVVHWLVLGRTFAVSGRYSALVDALRFRREPAPPEPTVNAEALIAALRAQTAAEVGSEALSPPEPIADAQSFGLLAPQTPATHVIFFAGVLLGAALSVWLAGDAAITVGLRGSTFASVARTLHVPQPVLLLLGGGLVGFGTRMAGGCTSGHGLCGVSQRQSGSLLATCAFFGAGVAVSFALGAVL